jgi:alkanesulfonate monooxygenase SsuD/methylene tetrahydromethanopterin reductase-like flavin-dependent oxidoreductase (luciferase family)
MPWPHLPDDFDRRHLTAWVTFSNRFEELEKGGYILVGSARTVVDRLTEMRKDLGFGLFIGGGRTGDMPRDKALKNMELFAREVMPHFRNVEPGTAG